MKPRLALLLLLAIACNRGEEAPITPAATATAEAPAADIPGNLLDLARGASVVSRTGELSYETSAAHAIDGDGMTHWISPPGGPEQTLVFVFAARVRISRLGISTTPGSAVRELQVDGSLDGEAWKPAARLEFESKPLPQLRDVAPFETRFLRLRANAQQYFTLISTVHAVGEELEAPRPGSIHGCWTIDGRPARFEQRGAQVQGVIEARPGYNEKTVQIEGGFDGRTQRLAWRAGAQWGFAMLSVAPDGQTISGLRWHERADNEGAGDGWLGTRGPCATTPFEPQAVRDRLLGEFKRYPLYGLRFDAEDRLMVRESEATLAWIAGATRIIGSRKRLESLRAALIARGVDTARIELVDAPERPFKSLAQKILNGSIEIETR